jgi:hypothetical protein
MNDTKPRDPLNTYEPPRIYEGRRQERPEVWYPGAVFWTLLTVCALGAVAGVVCLIRHRGV